MSKGFRDTDSPDTAWKPGTEDPIPLLWGRDATTAFLYRFFTCRPLDGHARTDATFWRSGSNTFARSGKTMAYNYWPGWKRGLLLTRIPALLLLLSLFTLTGTLSVFFHVLTGLTLFALTALWAVLRWLLTRPWPVPLIVVMLWAAHSTYVAVRTWEFVRNRQFERDYLRPIRGAVIAMLKTRDRVRLDIPRAMVRNRDGGVTGKIYLPMDHILSESDRASLLRIAAERLAHEALDARWNMEGPHPHMELFTPKQPPKRVTWEDMMERWDSDSPYLGESNAGRVMWDLGESSPHIGIIGTTGSGKSELVAWVVAQFLRGGAGCAVLDPKGTSHRWLMSIPQVAYCGTPALLTSAVVALDAELARRAEVNQAADVDQDFPRIVVVLEERNSMQDTLRLWWKENAPPGRRGEQAPAIGALNRLTSMGRSLNITVIMAAQETESRFIGSRSNYGAWAVAGRMGPTHWRTIMGPGGKKPAMSSTPGRFGYVTGGLVKVFQAAYPDLRDQSTRLIDWATGGHSLHDIRDLMSQTASDTIPTSTFDSASFLSQEFITLSDAAAAAGMSVSTLRTWRERDPDFPAVMSESGTTKYYNAAEMAAYIAKKTS